MSNWLGFSLTPHLRIDESFGREDHGGFSSVMPLRSDGSLYVVDPFRRSSNGAEGFCFVLYSLVSFTMEIILCSILVLLTLQHACF